MNRFTETQLEQAFIEMLQEQKYTYIKGGDIDRSPNEVLIKEDLRDYLHKRYKHEQITPVEIESIIRQLESFPSSDLYESNKGIMRMISDGFRSSGKTAAKKTFSCSQ
jgi:type I restriction enzyme R subunit